MEYVLEYVAMRFKTSFYIDECIDRCLDTRAHQKGLTKAKVIHKDLESLFLCLDIGKSEYEQTLTQEQINELKTACSLLQIDKMKTNFILSGEINNPRARDLAKLLSPLSRLSILDDSEVYQA
jgi:hypothetical protein